MTRWQEAPDRLRLFVGFAAALDGSPTRPRLFEELPFGQSAEGKAVTRTNVLARWRVKMPPDLASAMVRRGDRQPVLLIEQGSEEKVFGAQIQALRARLDSLHVRYADSTFTGGHIDQVRERLTHHVLPVIGRWFAQNSSGQARTTR